MTRASYLAKDKMKVVSVNSHGKTAEITVQDSSGEHVYTVPRVVPKLKKK
ncbi:hypothetical protein [Liquorilactobacillus hordei]|nr:hypothetical protein [Liquorilactobacillus hordei]QYH51069.1 hypothetical protein G6O70_00460 [Liquorilactobacillus hordei DSM 19519]